MRNTDRERNGMDFPKLFYPELYLLEGGYKAFFGQYPVRCACLCVLVCLHVLYEMCPFASKWE